MKTTPTQLVGRDKEIAEIEAMLGGAAKGAGSVLVVSAGAGLGKTALLDAAVEQAQCGGFTVLKARGSPSERDLPFGFASRLFEPVRTELKAAGLDTGVLFPPPAAGPQTGGGTGPVLPVGADALHRALAHLAFRTPVLVAVDDLQWLDSQSLHWLSTLPHRVDHTKTAVILTVCPGEPGADVAVLDELLAASAGELHLSALGPEAVRALLGRALSGSLDSGSLDSGSPDSGSPGFGFSDAALAAAVMQETGGNPLLVAELAAVLADRASAPTVSESAPALGDVIVPRLTSAVHARLRRISPHALDIARAVAVLGAEADLRRVTDLCGLRPEVVMEVLTILSRVQILSVTGHLVAFAQPLLRTTVLQNTPLAQVQSLHAQAASILRATGAPDDRVAQQLFAGIAPTGAWAGAVLRDAAAAALGRGEPEKAIACLHRALDEPVPPKTRRTLLGELGRAEGYLDVGSAIRRLTEASQHSAEPSAQGDAAQSSTALGDAVWDPVVRDLAEMLALTGRHHAAAELVGTRGDVSHTDRALTCIELNFDLQATAEAAAELLSRVSKPVNKGESEEGRHLSLLAMRTAWVGHSRTRAAALAQQALAALPVGPRSARHILRCAQVLAQAGLAEDGYERCDALVSHAQRWRHQPCLAAARSLRGVMAHRLGRIREAAEETRAALDLLVSCGVPRHSGTAVEYLARLVEALTDLSSLDEAGRLVEQAGLSGDIPQTWAGTALLVARGRLRIACGRPAEALRDLRTAGNRLSPWNVENPAVAAWRSDAAAALLMLGETNEARRQAAEAVEQARRWGAPGPLGGALRTLGVALGGSQGLAKLEESVSVMERSSARFELARSLSEYGSALSRAKRPAPARRALRAALELAQECDCAELARRSRIELVASGGRSPRTPGKDGVASLTAAELRTAMLAAKGKTNRELAEILLVRLRTVEVHLTNAYRKLGIEGRDQLAAVLYGRTPSRTGLQ